MVYFERVTNDVSSLVLVDEVCKVWRREREWKRQG